MPHENCITSCVESLKTLCDYTHYSSASRDGCNEMCNKIADSGVEPTFTTGANAAKLAIAKYSCMRFKHSFNRNPLPDGIDPMRLKKPEPAEVLLPILVIGAIILLSMTNPPAGIGAAATAGFLLMKNERQDL